MQKMIAALLTVAGIIHLLPVVGVLSANRLAALYGRSFDEPNLALLMRHRAVLFGLLGAFLIYAAFRPALRPLAFLAGFVSVVSFLVIAGSVGAVNDAVRRVVVADLVALVSLTMAGILYLLAQRQG